MILKNDFEFKTEFQYTVACYGFTFNIKKKPRQQQVQSSHYSKLLFKNLKANIIILSYIIKLVKYGKT